MEPAAGLTLPVDPIQGYIVARAAAGIRFGKVGNWEPGVAAATAIERDIDASPLKVLISWGNHPRNSKLSGLPVPPSQRSRTECHDVSGK